MARHWGHPEPGLHSPGAQQSPPHPDTSLGLASLGIFVAVTNFELAFNL